MKQGENAKGSVVDATGVAKERLITVGCVVVTTDVVKERLITASSVSISSAGIAKEGECAISRVEPAGIVKFKCGSSNGCVFTLSLSWDRQKTTVSQQASLSGSSEGVLSTT
jgi:hypothetical protein